MTHPWERIRRRGLQRWLPSYVAQTPQRLRARLARRDRTTHLMFLVCDHFEPRHAAREQAQIDSRLQAWSEGFGALQQWCEGEFGTRPLHTWFYPPHHGERAFAYLPQWIYRGLGEVELHYHHSNDTAATLRAGLRQCLDNYARWGLLRESGELPRTRFGFIHGDWALDNSCGGRFCGVNGELSILAEHGCWGDFTMPSGNECQTSKINAVYYAVDDPARSRSHDRGHDARVGVTDPAGLFLMQGPLGLRWQRPWRPRIENASLTSQNWGSLDRIRGWIDCNVHVHGRPDWLFIKLHAHGAIERDFDALFGERARAMHRVLNSEYNDGRRFRLHYVTARQAYNIAKAAEHGLDGDPQQYLDYLIQPPAGRYYSIDRPHELLRCWAQGLGLRVEAPADDVTLDTKVGPLQGIRGRFAEVATEDAARLLRIVGPADAAPWRVVLRPAPGRALCETPGMRLLADGSGELQAAPGSSVQVEDNGASRLAVRFVQSEPARRESA